MPLRLGVLTISDRVSRGEMEDRGGPAIQSVLKGGDFEIARVQVVPDDMDMVASQLLQWADEGLDVVLTTGGTGLGPRDVTPEATERVADRLVPGIAEALRLDGQKSTPHAMLSRGIAATCRNTLIVNLPGSVDGATQGATLLRSVLPHAIAIMHGGRH